MATAKKKKASGVRPRPSGPKKKPAAKKAAKKPPVEARSPKPEAQQDVDSSEAPRAERGIVGLECAQCHGTIDSGALRIALEAGEALHPGCTFGWTLDNLADTSATADWMVQLMQHSRLSPEDRAELLEELGAPAP